MKIIGFILSLFIAFTAFAEGKYTKEDATKLCTSGVEFYKKLGREKAIAELNKKDNQFFKGELYIFAINLTGTELINPANPSLVGKNLIALKDANGKEFVKTMIEVAKSKEGSGWVDYAWTNPETKKIQDKSTYVLKVDTDLFLGCGIY